MVYTPRTWVDGSTLAPEDMTRIETGIIAAGTSGPPPAWVAPGPNVPLSCGYARQTITSGTTMNSGQVLHLPWVVVQDDATPQSVDPGNPTPPVVPTVVARDNAPGSGQIDYWLEKVPGYYTGTVTYCFSLDPGGSGTAAPTWFKSPMDPVRWHHPDSLVSVGGPLCVVSFSVPFAGPSKYLQLDNVALTWPTALQGLSFPVRPAGLTHLDGEVYSPDAYIEVAFARWSDYNGPPTT